MQATGEVARLMRENAILKQSVAELEQKLFDEEEQAADERHFAMRQTQRLIDAGLWEPGQNEPMDTVATDFIFNRY